MLDDSTFDHANPAISRNLFSIGAEFRKRPGLGYSKAHGGFWIASRHQDVSSILRDNKNFLCSKRITLPPQKSPVPVIPLESDEPDHSFYRSVLAPLVTPKAVAVCEDHVRKIAVGALDKIATQGTGDAVKDFAAMIPARAMAMLFGFSDEDAYRFDAGFTALVAAAGGDAARQTAAVENFKNFLMEKIEYRRAHPTDSDLVSLILRHEVNGRRFTPEEQLGLMWSAAGGAIDTTKHAIGHAVCLLGKNRELRERLKEDHSLIPAFVDESLRYNASAFMDARYVANDIQIAGSALKSGERVLLVFGWANRDSAAFAAPDDIRLDRPPNRHLTFGLGIHLCAGMHLGRLEIKVAVQELLKRLPDFSLIEDDPCPTLSGGMMWGHQSLPIAS